MNIYEAHKSDQKLFKQFSIKDTLFVYYKCPQKEKVIQLYSPYNQFTFAIEGKKNFYQGNKSWNFSRNSGFLVKRTAYLEELGEKFNHWEIIAFYLPDAYLKRIFEEFRSHLPLKNLSFDSGDMILSIDINDRTRDCYFSLLPYFTQTEPLPESILEIKFKELLYNILINPSNRSVLSYARSIAEDIHPPIWEIMEANYMYNLKIQDYANLTNMSLASFKRSFKKHYNLSPGKWLLKRRLEHAKLLLETSHKPIGEIAFESGFINTSHFSRVFTENYKITAMNYRSSLNQL